MSRSVLMIAYHYPPLGGVAVMRVLRFSRYLRDYGWEPIVVCVDGGAKHEPRDADLLREVPAGIHIERVPCFEPDNFSDSWDIPREKVVRNQDDWMSACIGIKDTTPILGSAGKTAFDRIGFLIGPYAAGPYAEGSYDVTLPVTPAVIAAVKPEFRGSFSVSR